MATPGNDNARTLRGPRVARTYDRLAQHYDRSIGLGLETLLRGRHHRARAIDALGDVTGGTVLDIGCGTGPDFPLLAERVGASGRVVGVDCSAGMLREASRLVAANGWTNVELVRDDAQSLASIDEPVDAALSVWCYGLVEDLDAAIDRTCDLLRPGGTFVIMTFVRARMQVFGLRHLYPVCRFAVQRARLDTEGHFDDDRLRRRWARGRELLRKRLGEVDEQRYLFGTGAIFRGRKP